MAFMVAQGGVLADVDDAQATARVIAGFAASAS
jgi:hypothetical protein